MKIRTWKRLCAGALATVMAASMGTGTSIAAFAEALGNDGSAVINEAYADRESLMPLGPSFNIDTLLEWTPESDPDARYNRASIALADRVGGFVVNPRANPEAKLMLCSLANSQHDATSAQGTENFLSWSFNYWQYTDSFVYWAGSEEGLIVCPTGEFTDAAHTNGVPVVATLGFPWGQGAEKVAQVEAFCYKAEDGSFPVADKLLEVMEYYGFDGYFFNQESYGCSSKTAKLLNEMMHYMRSKCPDILISWYDSMINAGTVSYVNGVNDKNKLWLEKDATGNYSVDEFFMNYEWYAGQINKTIETMNAIGRSPFDAFAGLDVQQNCMDTDFRDHLLLDEDGLLKLSLALYCSNSTLGLATNGAQFHEIERQFYTNSVSDPRVETSNAASSSNKKWVGMSRFFADKTPITKAPFVTNFNSGHGTGYWVDGALSRTTPWSYQSNQDVMPTWTWIIDSEGSKLEGAYDFTDAYNGGNSIKFSGALDAGKANHIMLYSTHVAVTNGMTLSLTCKQTGGTVKLVAYYGDETTDSYENCRQIAYDLNAGEGWNTTTVNISAEAGSMLYALGIQVVSDTDLADVQVNLGQMTILEKNRATLYAPENVVLDEILYRDAYRAEARVYWDSVTGASSYEVYKVYGDGRRELIMETPNTALYLPTVMRNADEMDVTLEVIAINRNGQRGEGQQLVIHWAHSNEDSEQNLAEVPVNVCLNAAVTGVSFENDAEPASKALDGTVENNSKWCATNRASGWMSIDVGREVTIKRWRVEHAEYGGESRDMNTIDFALEYKTEAGNWVEAKRIKNNHAAVTDVLLDTPVTAQHWRLRVYDDGSSQWGGIRIYEWQMFESDQFPQTEPVMMHFASAVNQAGATDIFTLDRVPAGQTVRVYVKNGDAYTQIAQKTASGNQVSFSGLDFGTAEAGHIYYSTTASGSAESIKMSAAFEAEAAEMTAPATNVTFEAYSHPDSDRSSRGEYIYTTMTVTGLVAGDVVYIYENGEADGYTRVSLPVEPGEDSVTVQRVRVLRGGGQLALQIKRAGQRLSEVYAVDTPVFPEPTATIKLYARNPQGETLTGVQYGIYDEDGNEVTDIGTTSDSGGTVQVALGKYTLRCKQVPEGYALNTTKVTVLVVSENQTYEINVDVKPGASAPQVNAVTVTPDSLTLKKGATQQYEAVVTGENLTDETVTWSVVGGTSANTKIDANGLLTVGADETSAQLVVKATSKQDTAKFGTATVTVEQTQTPSGSDQTEQTQPSQTTAPATTGGDNTEPGSESSPVLWILIGVVVVMGAVIVVLLMKKNKK